MREGLEDSECCKIPSTNREFWVSKIRRNQERDQRNYNVLQENGWQVIVIWECQLKRSKMVIETASGGQECIRRFGENDYDMVFLDYRMPELDGIETTRRIREVVGNETPVIILTSYGWDDVADEAAGAGVDSFVSKPLFAATVMDKFKEALKKKNAQLIKKTASLKGKRILLAEDMDVNAEIMMMVLSMREMVAERANVIAHILYKTRIYMWLRRSDVVEII